MKATVLCENYAPMSFGIVSEHGFAALVETDDRTVLFDTGQGLGLIGNARLLGKDLLGVTNVVLSHGHRDHTGGIPAFFENFNANAVVAHPACFDNKIAERKIGDKTIRLPIGIPWARAEFERRDVELRLTESPVEIAKGVWFSGEVPEKNDFESGDPSLKVEIGGNIETDPFKDDAALYFKTDKGLSVISGCAHRGIVNTVKHAIEVVGDDRVYAVIGGMHLHGAKEERVLKTAEALRKFGPSIVAAGHCTGQEAAAILKRELGDVFRFMNVGQVFEL